MKKPILTIALVGSLFTAAFAQQQSGSQQQAARPAGAPATAQPAATAPQPKEAQAVQPAAGQVTAQPAQSATPAQPAAAEGATK